MNVYLSKKIRILSFIAILLVFLQHSLNFTGYIDPNSTFSGRGNFNSIIQYIVGYGIGRPAVALFFLLSGYLFFRNFTFAKTFEKYGSRIRTLFVPYIFWNALALFFIIGIQIIPPVRYQLASLYTGFLPGRQVHEYVQIIVSHGVAFQLWFLYDLMLYTLFAPVIYVSVRYLSFYLLIPLIIVWLLRIPVPSYLGFLERGGLFYLIGAYIALHPVTLPNISSKRISVFVGSLWILFLIIKTYLVFIPGLSNTYVPFIDNIAIVFGLLTIWFGYDRISENRLMLQIESVSIFTFFIYAAHEPLLELLKYAGITILGNNTVSLLVIYFAVPVCVFLVTIYIAKFMKRYMHMFYSILSGGR